MATSGELVTAVAAALDVEALGLNRESVFVAMRELRAAGEIPTSGRGLSGAVMTEREAAKLMIAVAGGVQVKNAPETVAQFFELPLACKPRLQPDPRELRAAGVRSDWVPNRPSDRAPSTQFPPGSQPNFGWVLELLIRRSRAGNLFYEAGPRDVAERHRAGGMPDPGRPYLSVTLDRPQMRATIAWGVLPYEFEEMVFSRWPGDDRDHPYWRPMEPPHLYSSRTFGLRAVDSIGFFLRYAAERQTRASRRSGKRGGEDTATER